MCYNPESYPSLSCLSAREKYAFSFCESCVLFKTVWKCMFFVSMKRRTSCRSLMFCRFVSCPAARILPSWLELQNTERLEAAGKSPTRELLWSWAQQNKSVGDLLAVLEDMGHERALHLFRPGGGSNVTTLLVQVTLLWSCRLSL